MKAKRRAVTLVELLVVVLVVGVISAFGAGIATGTIAYSRLRGAAERLALDFRAQRETAFARGPILPAGYAIGIHFFGQGLSGGKVDPSRVSYVPIGLAPSRAAYIAKPTGILIPDPAAPYAPYVVNLPPGLVLRAGPSPTNMTVIYNGHDMVAAPPDVQFSGGSLDGPSEAGFTCIDVVDPSLSTFYRITFTGPPGARANAVLTMEGQ